MSKINSMRLGSGALRAALPWIAAISIGCGTGGGEGAPSGRAAPSASAASVGADQGPGPADSAAVDLDDPSACAHCHGAVVEEWRASMHAQSHHSADPVYGALLAFRKGKEGAELGTKCASCHHPRELVELEGPKAKQGVGCASCHALEAVDLEGGKAGAKALVWGPPGVLRGPHDLEPGASPAHGTGKALGALSDGKTICLACHQEEKNKAGVPTCTTGIEASQAVDPVGCTSCHMPEVEGPAGRASEGKRKTHRSHAFLGPHLAWQKGDASFVASALEIDGDFEGDSVRVRLLNRSLHGFPTGFPRRTVVVALRGLDASGKELWRNVDTDPMKEHPEAVLNKVYVDADGKPVLPPYGVKLARDSRLAPDERRVLVAKLPKGVAKVEVEVRMWLLPKAASEAIGIAERPEASPRIVAKQTIVR